MRGSAVLVAVVVAGACAVASLVALIMGAGPQAQLIPLVGVLAGGFFVALTAYAQHVAEKAEKTAEMRRTVAQEFLTALDEVRSTTIAVRRDRTTENVEAADRAASVFRGARTALEMQAPQGSALREAADRLRLQFESNQYREARDRFLEVSDAQELWKYPARIHG